MPQPQVKGALHRQRRSAPDDHGAPPSKGWTSVATPEASIFVWGLLKMSSLDGWRQDW